MVDEKDLVEEVLSGNLDAFELLIKPWRKGLLNMAYRMTSNVEEAKEICQESFMRAFKYLRRYDLNKSFKNWLYQISINVTNDFLRKKKNQM